jgi:NtrC-family two-component system response regulator AlgB
MRAAEHVADPPIRVLVVDDERNIRKTVAVCLQPMGCAVTESTTPETAIEALTRSAFDIAFVDLRLGKDNGLDLVPKLLAARPGLDIIVITAFATIDAVVEAMRRGAKDCLVKPFVPSQIRRAVEQARTRRQLELRIADLEERIAEAVPEAVPEFTSPSMRALHEVISRAAAHDVPVLFNGESGTGKSVLARILHEMSPRRSHPFAVVNCPAFSDELLASELFGHVQGAFTGAVQDRVGRVEAAEGGTLFLDEVAEMPPSMQAKLLRFLQSGEFERLGEAQTRKADIRVVAATNRDLEAAVRSGRFREDLLFRLNVIEVTVPPLRERREEILPLARRFLAFFARAARKAVPELSPLAQEVLLAYSWPGNLRELRNAIERMVILSASQVLPPEALPQRIVHNAVEGPVIGGDFTVDQVEREHILRVLARARTQEEAAHILGVDGSTLWRKKRRYEGG